MPACLLQTILLASGKNENQLPHNQFSNIINNNIYAEMYRSCLTARLQISTCMGQLTTLEPTFKALATTGSSGRMIASRKNAYRLELCAQHRYRKRATNWSPFSIAYSRCLNPPTSWRSGTCATTRRSLASRLDTMSSARHGTRVQDAAS